MGEHTDSPLQKTAGRQAGGRSCGKFYRRNDQTFYRLKARLAGRSFTPHSAPVRRPSFAHRSGLREGGSALRCAGAIRTPHLSFCPIPYHSINQFGNQEIRSCIAGNWSKLYDIYSHNLFPDDYRSQKFEDFIPPQAPGFWRPH
jgi:hypothetical protein